MPEELRVFVRAALYVALVTAIYWFVSYEKAGTLLLGSLLVAAVLFVVVGRSIGRRNWPKASFVAFDDEGGDVDPPLEIEEEPVVTVSPWPLLGAAGAMLVGLGLLYGPWLWLPGAGLAIAAGYGWITQTDA
ncbi:MAG TPA: cytochrome c oxidase subunit 4 [Actinomycetota bacterium]|nr:cytochrome c oxidase subunit 4 [Actinomycetota bacterium]